MIGTGRVRVSVDLGARADHVAVGVGVTALAVLSMWSGDEPASGSRSFDVGALLLLAVGAALVLLGGRRAPALVAAAVVALALVWYGVGYQSSLVNLVTLVAFYNLGLHGERRRGLAVLAVTAAAVTTAMVVVGDEAGREAASAVGWVVAVALLGSLVRHRRLLVESYRQRAEQAEAEREAEAERRAAQVRVDVARDLHDLLAHTVAAMTVQAGVASDALDRDPDAARRALREIRAAGREAMAEVRSLVHVLRDGSAPATGGNASPLPVPALDRVGDLVPTVEAADIAVTTEIDEDLDLAAIPDAVALTAYRVVQESLTNVVRHSGARHVDLTVRRSPDRPEHLEIVVADDGHGSAAAPGVGLVGMHERVDAVGGSLCTGPGPDRGWRVTARLPLQRERS